MKLKFDRSHYLSNQNVFEERGLEEVDQELCEFNEDVDDIAYELAYTRYALAKAEAKIHNIEEGLKRLGKLISYGDTLRTYANGFQLIEQTCLVSQKSYDVMTAPTLPALLDKILTGGE